MLHTTQPQRNHTTAVVAVAVTAAMAVVAVVAMVVGAFNGDGGTA